MTVTMNLGANGLAKPISKERLMSVLVSPRITDKAYRQSESSYLFEVLSDATKHEVKSAVEFLFNVKVDSVNSVTVKGKRRRFAGRVGVMKSFKKAYVKLMPGEKIELLSSGA